jgi:hypothetical protein
VLLSGCVHKQQAAPLAPQAKTPNIYVPPPTQADLPPMVTEPPPGVTDAKPVVAEEAKPKKRNKKQPTSAPLTPVVAAAVPPPAEAAQSDAAQLGALGSGEDASPKQQQDVAARISAVEKRLTDLPAPVQDREQKQIAKVRLFNKEASDALKGGDVDGARILATKAALLLDDLTK